MSRFLFAINNMNRIVFVEGNAEIVPPIWRNMTLMSLLSHVVIEQKILSSLLIQNGILCF